MKKSILFVAISLFFFNCKESVENNEATTASKKASCSKTKKFDMYKSSEMAVLMRQMFAENAQLKDRILKGDAIGTYPSYFSKIYTAKFTDETDNDAVFKEKAADYIEAQQHIYSDPKNAKTRFNAGVDACVSCHESKCGGPIPKIKKLYIN
jgi:hypothetical protein